MAVYHLRGPWTAPFDNTRAMNVLLSAWCERERGTRWLYVPYADRPSAEQLLAWSAWQSDWDLLTVRHFGIKSLDWVRAMIPRAVLPTPAYLAWA